MKTKTIKYNYRLEVTVPDPTGDIFVFEKAKEGETQDEKDHHRWGYALKNMADEVQRHCDIENVQTTWDSREVCFYCDEPLESAFDSKAGKPACCEKAVDDFEAPETRLAPCPICAGLTDQDFVELEGGENGSDWHCRICKRAVV